MKAHLLIGIAVMTAAVLAGAALETSAPRPRLDTVQDLPSDVSRLTEQTWDEFMAVFGAKAGCLGDVSLELVEEVDGGAARYVATDPHIEIEIPTTRARYRESLVHELGHHLEEVCGVIPEIGTEFRDAQQFDADTEWTGGGVWAHRPTEHFAEAVVQLVVGDRQTHGDVVELTPQSVDLVNRWAASLPTVQMTGQ